MRLWLLIPAAVWSISNRERCATRHGGHSCAIPDQNLGQANLVSAFRIARSIVPMLTGFLLGSSLAGAQNGAPAPRPSDEFSFMQMLADKGLHDIENESWNAYGQFTYISSWKPSFYAPYTNLNGSINSLLPTAERSFTGTATLYLGYASGKAEKPIWFPNSFRSARSLSSEDWAEPSRISSCKREARRRPRSIVPGFSSSRRSDSAAKAWWRSQVPCNWEPITTAGDLSLLPATLVFSTSSTPTLLTSTLARVFSAWDSSLTRAYDFASDARGYSWGGLGEFYWDDWAVRVGRITPPKDPNQLPVDFRLFKYYGDQMEVEHKHTIRGQEGMVRVLAYRNRENMGRFSDAIAAFEADPRRERHHLHGHSTTDRRTRAHRIFAGPENRT